MFVVLLLLMTFPSFLMAQDLSHTGDWQFDLGRWFSCAAPESKSLYCWGLNKDGQTEPPQVNSVQALDSGPYVSCAIADHRVQCWGSNEDYVLNVPHFFNPVEVAVGGYMDDGGGAYSFGCAIDDFGLKCWYYKKITFEIPAIERPHELVAGGQYACTLTRNGIKCGTAGSSGAVPQVVRDVPNLRGAEQLAGGNEHVCALLDGTLHCWGKKSAGNLDVPTDLGRVKKVYASEYTTCALLDSGRLRCWGGWSKKKNVPADLDIVSDVAMAPDRVCAKTQSGIRCWGSNEDYHYGNYFIPGGLSDLKDIAIAEGAIFAVHQNRLSTWGFVREERSPSIIPKEFSTQSYRSLYVGKDSVCAQKVSGEVDCWGDHLINLNHLGFDLKSFLGRPKLLSVGGLGVCASDDANVRCYRDVYSRSYALPNVSGLSVGNQTFCARSKGEWNCYEIGPRNIPHGLPPEIDQQEILDLKVNMKDEVCARMEQKIACWKYIGSSNMDYMRLEKFLSEIKLRDFGFSNKHLCTLDEEAKVSCWDISDFQVTPWKYQVPSELGPVLRLKVGFNNTCALTSAGWSCWGDNTYGQNNFPWPDLRSI